MMIVLAIITTLAAMCWPALRNSLERGRVQHAGKLVGTELLRCRIRAIETGAVWQFRFQPNSTRFDIGRRQSTVVDPNADPNADPAAQEPPEAQDLPDGVTFFEPQPPANSDDSATPPPTGTDDDQRWAAPIVFQPNGRSSNGFIRLAGQQNYYVDVELRGMLGSVAVGQAQQQSSDDAASGQTPSQQSAGQTPSQPPKDASQ